MSAAIGLLGAVGVTASGWALQAAALPAPKPADQVIADTGVWLHEHRLVLAVVRMDERRFTAACVRGGGARKKHRGGGGTVLSIGPRSVFLVPHRGPVRILAGTRPRVPRPAMTAAAVCSSVLERLLARAAQTGAHIGVERAYAARQSALALQVQRVHLLRLTVYVAPRTFRPLVVIVHSLGRTLKARLYLPDATPGLLRRLHLVRRSR